MFKNATLTTTPIAVGLQKVSTLFQVLNDWEGVAYSIPHDCWSLWNPLGCIRKEAM